MLTPDTHKIKRAIISVSEKTGIVDLAKELSTFGIEIFSTGGTMKTIAEAGVPVKSISDITGFPEIMDGRVKTLHPNIHAGLLSVLDNEEHVRQMQAHNIDSIDLLIVNLYPFEASLDKKLPHDEMIENIDIGGPGMLRAAAKNYLWTAPVVNPSRYPAMLDFLRKDCTLPEAFRLELACDVFTHTSYYDSLISGYLREKLNLPVPDEFAVPLKKAQHLRYGENPHQNAGLYGNFNKIFNQLHGKELSYNNIVDIDAAAKLILEFDEPSVAIIKHTNPSGVGSADTLKEAYEKAFATDKVSPFGGIIAVNRAIDIETAETMHALFTEVIIAPEFSEEALALLTKKKDRRLITADYKDLRNSITIDLKSVAGGFLIQDSDKQLLNSEALKIVTKRQPTDKEFQALLFGWKVCKHVKSNTIVYALNDRTLGIGAGQMSRVDSSRIAIEKSKMMELDLKGSVVASDAFFPFADGVMYAVEAGATAIIQPGGSVRDEEVIAAADEHGIAMVFTGMRHFRH
jgi:phosphoribosylaminoimidazolecarboxamide formyltransferase/IMP cyclohydrolase